MREDGNAVRRIGTVVLLALVTSIALAVSNDMSPDQEKPPCGTPASLDDGWSMVIAAVRDPR